jgi:hypothetical protein
MMGSLRRFLPLFVLCCAVTGLVSAQSISITFLNDWGEQASRVLEEGRALLRVVDPGANVSPGRDQVTVDLSAANSLDLATTNLVETGEATGIFEGEVAFTTDFYLDYLADDEHVATWAETWPAGVLDVATATYGSASTSTEAGPSLVDLLLEDGSLSPASFAMGDRVRVRVRDPHADLYPGQDRTTAVLTSSGGDSETLTLTETGVSTGVFEISLPLVAGAPAAQDGQLQTADGETLSVTHADSNGFSSSSDTAGVTAASVRFIDRREGKPTEVYVESGEVVVRVVDLAADLDPAAFDSAAVTLYRSVDTEPLTLRETGTQTGVFEGRMRLEVGTFGIGNGFLEPNYLTDPPVTGMAAVFYGSLSDTAKIVQSLTRLLDDSGEDAVSVAPGQALRIQVEAARGLYNGQLDSVQVQVRSMTTGDEESLALFETGSFSWMFEGTLQPVLGAAAAGDGQLQVQAGEVLEVEHLDVYNLPRSRDQVKVVRSAVRFVDAGGSPVSMLLNKETAHVEVLDLLSAGQAPPSASIESYYGGDLEHPSLTEPGTPGLFAGSVPLTPEWSTEGDGILYTGFLTYPRHPSERLTARANGASAKAVAVSALLEFLDDRGEPVTTAAGGGILRVRARAPGRNLDSSQAESLLAVLNTLRSQDLESMLLEETGPDTGVFEGTFPTLSTQAWAEPDGLLMVRPSDAVTVYHDPPTLPSETDMDRFVAALAIVPVLVELVDGGGRAASTYLFDETIHLRVSEPEANTSPASAETIPVQVQAWRRSDSGFDLESVVLTETGPDTGVFTGTLATATLSNPTPSPGNGVLDLPEISPLARDATTVTATRSGASDSAVFADSELWLTDTQDQDATSFPIGSSIRIWLRRPYGNVSPGIDSEGVAVRTRTAAPDQEWVTLTETGVDTGLFTGLLPVVAGPAASYDGLLAGSSGDLFEASKGSAYFVFSFDRGVLAPAPPVNAPPDAVDDFTATDEDMPVTVSVRVNDTDADGDLLTITAVTQGTKGTASHDGATVTYTPDADANGVDSFTYTISDGNGGSDTATVTITVTGQNDPPVVANDAGENGEDAPIVISVLDNDMDPELQALTVTAVTQGVNGTVAITGGTQVTYTPAPNFHGSDNFTYTAADPQGLGSVGTVSVTVTPLNDPPVAVDDAATTPEDTAVTITVLGNDTDADGETLTVDSVTQSPGGAVTTNGTTVTFTPSANLSGTYHFTYTVRDPAGSLDTASVAVTVTAVNDPPTAAPDAAATNEDTPVSINVLANDSDLDGGTLSVSAVTQGAQGAVASNGTSVTYTPAANVSGADSFTYMISDGQGGTATATVTVSVAAVNDAPATAPDSGATREAVPVIIAVLANDTDVEGNPLSVTIVSTPPNGITSRLPDNTVRYTPHANFTGSETFSYTVSDGQGGTSTGQVTVAVGEALERVAVLATNSVALRTGSDVLSGDVIVNQAGAGPFLSGVELSAGGSVTAAANYDLEGDSVTVAAGAVIGSDVRSNQLTNSGTINGQQLSPLSLPVFPVLPPFLTATPGTTTITVGTNGTRTLAAGSYLDLIVGRKATVTFTGGVYHFRTIQVDREAKLYFSAASVVRVQQKLSTKNLVTIGPAVGAAIDASAIVLYVAGVNGTGGGLTATPKAVEIGVDNTLKANLYAPNGTIWLQDRTQATGAFLGKDIDVGVDAQVRLDSAFSGGP